jgi:uncharacterized protein involved in cysteine biosynthesis
MIFDAFFKTLAQTGDPRFRRVLLLGVGLTLTLLITAYVLFFFGVQWLVGPQVTLPILGEVSWLDDFLSIGSVFLMMVLSVFLMIPVASAITSLFLNEVAQAVEDRHYPNLPKATEPTFLEGLRDTVNFLGVLILANLLALALYFMFAPVAMFIFWGLNGFFLGREYFTLAAARRVGMPEARKLRRKHMGTIWLAGTLMAMPLSIPLLNLVIPILGAATFTHIFHGLPRHD